MTRFGPIFRLLLVLAAVALVKGCGDGDSPIAPPPDPPRPTTVAVSPATAELSALGATVQLTAEVRDQSGNVMVGATVAWTTSVATVATVSSSGLVTAAGNGTATITASAGSVSGSARITVDQAISAVRVSPRSVALVVGDTVRLEAMALDARDAEVPGAEFEWSSSDTTVATVDGTGLVHGRAIGAAMVAASLGELRDSTSVSVSQSGPVGHHAALTAGLPERPFLNTTVGGQEGSTQTVGTLRLDLNPDAFPVIVDQGDMRASVLVAGSLLGSGRVVAFSGQDFLGSDERATLVGHEHMDRLIANAVRWAAGNRAEPLRILADNQRVAGALQAQGLGGVDVVRGSRGRDWSANALGDADVAVVQVNEWGTARLAGESLAPLRAFVENGGGLVIAGSALQWSWWIEQDHGAFAGNTLLLGTGISWNEDSIDEIESATTRIDLRALTPAIIWEQYVSGEPLDAAQVSLLPPVFSAALELGRLDELDAALVRLVSETPPLPATATAPKARLAADVASSLGPHEWPETHPWATAFPGLPAPAASREGGSVVVDATWGEFPADSRRRTRHFPLEFYAPPGGLVTISVPASHATGELTIEVGQGHNDLRRIPEHTVWRRAPALRRTFKVTAAETRVTNAYGGSLALVVPPSYRGTIPVTVEGAIPMAVYTAGESNATEWLAALDAGAPQAIIQEPGGIRLVISAEKARSVTDPGEVAAFWDGFRQHHAELASEPVPRAYESTWIFDPQVGYGYANAGWLTINYPLHGEHWALVPGTAEGRTWLATLRSEGPKPHVVPPSTGYSPRTHGVDWWLFGHELGHQWQTEDWGHGSTYPQIGEVAVNLFTMHALNHYLYGGDDSTLITGSSCGGGDAVNHSALANLRWPTAGACERLGLYRQLIAEFGWAPIRQVFRSYYDPAYPRSTYGGELDGFAIRFSAIVQRDLVGFFRRWEYPLSGSAAGTIRSFGLDEWLPPGW